MAVVLNNNLERTFLFCGKMSCSFAQSNLMSVAVLAFLALLSCFTKWWQVGKRLDVSFSLSVQNLDFWAASNALRLKWDFGVLPLPVTLHTREAFLNSLCCHCRWVASRGAVRSRSSLSACAARRGLLNAARPKQLMTPNFESSSIILVNDWVNAIMFKWKAMWRWGLSPMCCNAVNTVMVSAVSLAGQQRVNDWNVTRQCATSSSVCPVYLDELMSQHNFKFFPFEKNLRHGTFINITNAIKLRTLRYFKVDQFPLVILFARCVGRVFKWMYNI